MFSGNEWLILVVGAGLVAIVVLLVVWASRGGHGAAGLAQARVRGDAGSVLDDLQLSLSTSRNTVCRRDPSGVTAEWSFVPVWAILIAVLLFPIGLVALVARRTVSGTVIAEPAPDRTVTLRIGGQFNKTSVRAINSVIDARS